jgi:hypothetical protein
MAVHSEDALHARFVELDKDGSGRVEMPEVIKFALRDAISRSAVPIATLLGSWDTDDNGEVDRDEFRRAVRFFGFKAVCALPPLLHRPSAFTLSPITYHLSPITHHLSPITYHLSPMTPDLGRGVRAGVAAAECGGGCGV